MATLLGYKAKIHIQPLRLKFVTIVYNFDKATTKQQRYVAIAGCSSTFLCGCILNILPINHNLKLLFNLYSLIFLINLHPRFPDGRIFWQEH
jgi:hypothetical protein